MERSAQDKQGDGETGKWRWHVPRNKKECSSPQKNSVKKIKSTPGRLHCYLKVGMSRTLTLLNSIDFCGGIKHLLKIAVFCIVGNNLLLAAGFANESTRIEIHCKSPIEIKSAEFPPLFCIGCECLENSVWPCFEFFQKNAVRLRSLLPLVNPLEA